VYWSIHNRAKGTFVASSSVSWKISIGKHCWIRQGAEVCSNVTIGDYSYIIGPNTYVEEAVIGKFCSIARNVIIGPTNHNYHWVSTHPFIYSTFYRFIERDKPSPQKAGPVIGNDVWIGANSVILRGTKIGHGAAVAAGSVVARDVAPYSIVAGVPARHIKYRFPEHVRDALLELKWWDWGETQLREAIPLLYDVDEFIGRHDGKRRRSTADDHRDRTRESVKLPDKHGNAARLLLK
jgi:acetyltransferase-like isoleucine patch superfamily enzyme